MLAPKITVTNEEKLVATITCMRQGQDNKPLSFDVVLSDDEGHELNLKYKPVGDKLVHAADDLHLADTSKLDDNEKSSIVGRSYTLKITLDDLSEEKLRFASLYGKNNLNIKDANRQLTAGTALHIKVTVRSANHKIDGLFTEYDTNSLFADQSTSNQAVVYYGRHLQNLDLASGVTEGITEAVVKNPVHFEKQEDKEEGDTSSWYSCYGDKAFTPITNTYLKKFSGERTAIIYHLTVKEGVKIAGTERKGAGMFAVLKDSMTVENLRLAGTTIAITGEGKEKVSVGAIAGETTGSAKITNCEVYLDTEDIEGKNENDVWISGAGIQGGLIGHTNSVAESGSSVTIVNSFAATVMDGRENGTTGDLIGTVGGLIGQADCAVNIKNCYADSYLTGDVTGGLIGSVNSGSVNVEYCYTAGYQNPANHGGGLVASSVDSNALKIKNSYTVATYLENSESNNNPVIYAVSPGTLKNVYYLNKGKNVKNDNGEAVDYLTFSNKAKMAEKLNNNGSNSFTTSTTTYAYNLRNQGLTSYSYPSLKDISHYGDWQASYEAGSLVYYEKYAINESNSREYGFFGGNVQSSLSDSLTVVGDGYGIVYAKSALETLSGFIVSYQNSEDADKLKEWKIDCNSTETEKFEVSVNDGDIAQSEETYVIFPLPKEIMNAQAIKGVYYQKLTVKGASDAELNDEGTAAQADGDETTEVMTGKTFYFNPHFAKSVEAADQAPNNILAIYLRTPRQLYHMSLYYQDYASLLKGISFIQERDIDYAPYDWKNYEGVQEAVTVQSPVGVAEDGTITPFTSTYKGGGYEIRGISFATKGTAVGFIGENQGSIQNVFLVSDWENNDFTGTTAVSNPYLSYTGTIGSNRNVYMGALAGINKGTIQNCAVCGYSMGRDGIVYVQRNGTLYIGGLTGSNQGNIYNSEVDAPAVNANVLYGNAYWGGFAGENIGSGLIRNSYAVGNVSIEYSKGANCTIGGFTAKNTGVLKGDYCAVALGAAGTSKPYGFSPKGGGVVSSDCYYLSGGTFRYLNNMLPFSNDQGAGIHVTYQEMVEKAMKGTMADESRCNGATDEENYPFNAVVTKEGKKVHYGNWQIPVNLGSIGVIYWEHEEGGANDGYHFSYIGYKASSQDPTSVLDKVGDSTLCTRHDDGGRITEYGYGYYYATGSAEPDPTMYCFQAGDSENAQASENLTNQLDGVTVVAYTTAPAIGISRSSDTSCYMKMTANDRTANGIWQFSYNSQLYTFTINPFFANAMQYGSNSPDYDGIQSATVTVLEDGFEVQVNAKEAMPGENGKEYEIRSAEQLQYLNWNYKTGTATKILDTTDDVELVDKYSYLGYMTGNDAPVSADYNWIQSHDVDANMTSAPDGGNVFFTQIGSMYDAKSSANVVDADASISYFNGVYNGNTYSIKNIEINSKNTVTGLFGSIIGAKVSNVILYSEKGNYIQRYSGKERGWHVLGGLCGLAAVGKGNSAENVKISNCTVSGYTIQDNSDKGAYGDSSIGGMFGMSTMDLRECTAVNTIIINMTENNRTESVRVGGLVGSMRGVISNCYTGGEITCTDTCLQKRGTRLMLAGISGGIYIKNKGNLLELLGNSILGIEGASDDTRGNAEQCKTATTIIQNCYTYIKMPIDKAKRITSIEPIGSNGETHDEKYKDWGESNYHVRIQITNCYYYEDNIPVIRHEYMAGKNWNNIDDTAIPLSWAEMSGEKDVDSTIGGKTGENAIRVTGSFVELLNQSVDSEDKYAIRGTFAKVTTEENDQDVDGKYSFPGNRTDLEGENYPFPTILTQKTKRGTSVNVHYGAWPLEGIFWRESRATMDIFEDMDLEHTDDSNQPRALKTFYLDSNLVGDDSLGEKLTLNNGFTVEYSNGDDKDDTATAAVSQQSDWSDGFSEGVEISDGTETFVSASEVGDNVQTETQTSDQKDYIAQIVKLEYSEAENCYVATVEALKTGTTVITVRATVRKTVDNQEIELEYQASFTLTVTADLTVYSDSAEIKGELHQTSDSITLYAVPTSQALSVKEAGSSGSTAEVGADGFSSDGSGVAIEEDAAQSEESGISMESLEADVDTENLDDVGGFEAGEDYADMVTESEEAGSYGSSNFESAPESNSENSAAEYFESDPETASGFEVEISEGQNVQTSGDQKIAVYVDTAPSKNFASMMTWTITEDPVGAVTVSEISDNQFTVTIESLVPATLTVKGTYTYKGVEYTSYTWINVIGLESGQTVSTDPSDSETGADWSGSSADSANYSSDAASGWEDQNNDTIDIIPNESADDFSEDDSSWESGDSGF